MPTAYDKPASAGVAGSTDRTLAEVCDLRVDLGQRTVLNDVSLTISRGEIVTIIGPNGSGKTTLVRALLGLTPPAAGIAHLRPDVRVGYVPQRFAVDPILPLTVRRLLTLTDRASDADMTAALDRVGVSHLIHADVATLSGGETQRVLLARALMRRPDLLVLDEPAQGVDFTGEAELYELIGLLRDELDLGVLMVSHDLHVVMAATDRVLCLNGHICCAGVPADVSRHPEFLRMFGSRAASTLAVYRHEHDHSHDLDGEVIGDAHAHDHHHHHHH